MTADAKGVLIDTAGKLVKLLVGTIAIGGTVAAAFAVYYGLETSDHADKARAVIRANVELRETKEHAAEQHERIDRRIDQIQVQQTEALGRIEQTLEKLDARTWTINDRLKNGGAH